MIIRVVDLQVLDDQDLEQTLIILDRKASKPKPETKPKTNRSLYLSISLFLSLIQTLIQLIDAFIDSFTHSLLFEISFSSPLLLSYTHSIASLFLTL